MRLSSGGADAGAAWRSSITTITVITIFLMMAGLYIVVVARSNMVKKLIGLSIFQTSVYLLYIEPGKIIGGTAPIIDPAFTVYSNPLPHVLILTAIVVGVATLALGLALVVRINEAYGTIEEDEIFAKRGRRLMALLWPHLPALQVVIPLLGALLAALLRRGVLAFCARAGRELDHAVHRRRHAASRCWALGRSPTHLGGWEPPWGIEYRVDVLNGFVLMLVSIGRRCDHAVRPPQHRVRDRGAAGGLVLLHVSAVPDRAARHHDHR